MRKKFKSMEEKDYEEKNDERSDGSSSDSGTFRRLRRGRKRQAAQRPVGRRRRKQHPRAQRRQKRIRSAGAGENTEAGNADGGEYTVAVVKQIIHASLDEIAAAVCEELDALAEKNGVSIQYEVYSGQGDQSVLTQIGDPGDLRAGGCGDPHCHPGSPGHGHLC